jgi:hypothetical protein
MHGDFVATQYIDLEVRREGTVANIRIWEEIIDEIEKRFEECLMIIGDHTVENCYAVSLKMIIRFWNAA